MTILNQADMPAVVLLLLQTATFSYPGEWALSAGAPRQVAGSQGQATTWELTRTLISNT